MCSLQGSGYYSGTSSLFIIRRNLVNTIASNEGLIFFNPGNESSVVWRRIAGGGIVFRVLWRHGKDCCWISHYYGYSTNCSSNWVLPTHCILWADLLNAVACLEVLSGTRSSVKLSQNCTTVHKWVGIRLHCLITTEIWWSKHIILSVHMSPQNSSSPQQGRLLKLLHSNLDLQLAQPLPNLGFRNTQHSNNHGYNINLFHPPHGSNLLSQLLTYYYYYYYNKFTNAHWDVGQ